MIEKRRAGGVEVEVEEEKEKWPLILGDRSWWNRSTSKLVVVQLLAAAAAIAAVFIPQPAEFLFFHKFFSLLPIYKRRYQD